MWQKMMTKSKKFSFTNEPKFSGPSQALIINPRNAHENQPWGQWRKNAHFETTRTVLVVFPFDDVAIDADVDAGADEEDEICMLV